MRSTKAMSKTCSIWSILLLLLCMSGEQRAAAQSPSFQTGKDISAQRAAEKPTLVGQSLWLVPNTLGKMRIGFAKSFERKDLKKSARLYPTSVQKIQIAEKIPPSQNTGFKGFYRVKFADGSSGFLEAVTIEISLSEYTTDSITKQNVNLARRDLFDTWKWGAMFPEKFFKEDPAELKSKIASVDSANQKAKTARHARGGVSVGMTKDQVLASSWGKPSHVNETITTGIVSEQWVYPGNNSLYFDNGVLTAIQKSE